MTTKKSQQSTKSTCSKDDKRTRCEVWTRVMGYHRPVSQYNKGKKSEFYSRVAFSEQISANSRFIEMYT